MLRSPLGILMSIWVVLTMLYFAVALGFNVWTSAFLIFTLVTYVWAVVILMNDE